MNTPNLDALMASVRLPVKPLGMPFDRVGGMMGAQANGAESGRKVIRPILARMRREPHLVSTLPDLIMASIEAGAAVLIQAEMSPADVQAWKVGFVNAANALVHPFFQEMQALLAPSRGVGPIHGSGEPPEIPVGRSLRPEDFGALPTR